MNKLLNFININDNWNFWAIAEHFCSLIWNKNESIKYTILAIICYFLQCRINTTNEIHIFLISIVFINIKSKKCVVMFVHYDEITDTTPLKLWREYRDWYMSPPPLGSLYCGRENLQVYYTIPTKERFQLIQSN